MPFRFVLTSLANFGALSAGLIVTFLTSSSFSRFESVVFRPRPCRFSTDLRVFYLVMMSWTVDFGTQYFSARLRTLNFPFSSPAQPCTMRSRISIETSFVFGPMLFSCIRTGTNVLQEHLISRQMQNINALCVSRGRQSR